MLTLQLGIHLDHLGPVIACLVCHHLNGDDITRLDVRHRIFEQIVEAPAAFEEQLSVC